MSKDDRPMNKNDHEMVVTHLHKVREVLSQCQLETQIASPTATSDLEVALLHTDRALDRIEKLETMG